MEKNWITTIQALLKGRNDEFDAADKKRVRLIRHKDNRKVKVIDGKEYANSLYDIYLHDNDVFMAYQSEQVKKRFLNVDYIVAFIGEEGVSSRFVGVYKNCGVIKDIEEYHDEEQAKFDLLDYSQLHVIFKTNNAEWKAKLESCNCIYLILDKNNGKQYVGSTYNRQGIWGRWSKYAETGHGNDKDLIPLLLKDPNYAKKNFQWCILETLPLSILGEQAIDRESLYKRKFGTRDFGYNNN